MSEEQATIDDLDEVTEVRGTDTDEWQQIEMGQLAKYQNGNSFSKSEWTDSGYPIIRIQNLTGEQEEFNYFDGELDDRYRVKNGDLLLSWSATIDVFEWDGTEAALNQHIYRVDTTDRVNEIFFRFKLEDLLPRLEALSHGSTMKHVRKADLVNLSADIPPLEEQRKIASVLHTVDQAIQKTEEIIDQTEKVQRGLIQDLLNDGINEGPKRETDTRFGQLPESWELRPLKEIGDIAGRTAPEKDETDCWGGDIPWATPSEITSLEGPTIRDTEEHLTEIALEKVSSNLLPPESILLTTRATIGECAVNTVEMTTNQGFKNFVPDDRIDTWYAYYRLKYEGEYLASLSKGSTFPEVGKETVENFLIPVPPLEEQEEIGERLRSVDEMVLSYKSNKNQLKRLKQGLMQDLLSGEVRTHDKDIEVVDDVLQYG